MRIWFALLIAPVLALLDQAIAFAVVGWSCAHQTSLPLHATHAVFVAMTTAAVVMAWRVWQETSPGADGHSAQRHFLAGAGVVVAVFALAAEAAMWTATGTVPACSA